MERMRAAYMGGLRFWGDWEVAYYQQLRWRQTIGAQMMRDLEPWARKTLGYK
jgi:hypothetical protein